LPGSDKKKVRTASRTVAARKKAAPRTGRRHADTGARELASLTEREREILEAIGEGRSTADIARDLAIAISTVRKHRENMMRKLDLHTTAEIVLYVVLHRDDLDKL
jgi:DNA-binding NarL/FixJ family response regulator